MIIYRCDICGKEIPVSQAVAVELRRMDIGGILGFPDLGCHSCLDCLIKFNPEFETLKEKE